MGEGEVTTPKPELLPPGKSVGLNDLLRRPDAISRPQSNLGQNIEVRVINNEEWQLLYSILGKIKPLMGEASNLDREGGRELYTLEVPVNRDNGIFLHLRVKSAQNKLRQFIFQIFLMSMVVIKHHQEKKLDVIKSK